MPWSRIAAPLALLVIAASLGTAHLAAQQPLSPTPAGSGSQAGSAGTSASGRLPAGFVGDRACLPCHQAKSISFLHTGHHLTSQMPDADSVLGSFERGSNVLVTRKPGDRDPAAANQSPGVFFRMETDKDGYYQTAACGWPGHYMGERERIDVVIGSGARGQSYLYWQGDALFELPVSYWVDGKQWINSPGFEDGKIDFIRRIYPRCLECHATYIQALSNDPLNYHYNRASLVTGISCESCHGPGAAHVAMQNAHAGHPAEIHDQRILNPAKFPRDRQVDLCAWCHNGPRLETMPSFSYKPGEPLDNYFKANLNDIVDHPDVHGNQVGLLKRSRCYLSSPAMSCSTCHDEHAPEQGAASYSSRCLGCHQVQSCGIFKTMGRTIAQNCIDCHMPLQATKAIISVTAGRVIPAAMRSHWIKVYPQTNTASSSPSSTKATGR